MLCSCCAAILFIVCVDYTSKAFTLYMPRKSCAIVTVFIYLTEELLVVRSRANKATRLGFITKLLFGIQYLFLKKKSGFF